MMQAKAARLLDIKAIRVQLPQVQLLPMGGVLLESVADYVRAGCFAVGVGSDLV